MASIPQLAASVPSIICIAALLVPMVSSAGSSNCYKADGKLQDSKFGWVPCSPDLPSSPCCSGIDYCLDNGLCLNAGVVNNVYTVQGCTDPSWGGDCRKFCAGSIDGNGYVTIILCDGANNACCGDNGSCCSDPNKLFKLPFFTNLKHPGEGSQNSTNAGNDKPTIVTVTVTNKDSSPTSSAAAGGSSGTDAERAAAAASANGTNSSSDQAMKVGLGVGIPLGFLLLVAVGYLIWELRKRRKGFPGVMAVADAAAAAGSKPNGVFYEADSHSTNPNPAATVPPNFMPVSTEQQSQTPAPKYQEYPHPQYWPSAATAAAELPEQGMVAAHQLPGDSNGRLVAAVGPGEQLDNSSSGGGGGGYYQR